MRRGSAACVTADLGAPSARPYLARQLRPVAQGEGVKGSVHARRASVQLHRPRMPWGSSKERAAAQALGCPCAMCSGAGWGCYWSD